MASTALSIGVVLTGVLALAALGTAVAGLVIGRRQRRVGRDPAGLMRVLTRLELDPGHSLHLVQVGDRVLLLGVGGGPIRAIAELQADAAADAAEVPLRAGELPAGIVEAVRRAQGRAGRRRRGRTGSS